MFFRLWFWLLSFLFSLFLLGLSFIFLERTIAIRSSSSIVLTGLAVRFVVSTDCTELVAGLIGLARLPLLSFPFQMMAYSCPSKDNTSGVGESMSAQRVQPPIFKVEFWNSRGSILRTNIPSSIAASSKSDLFAATGKFRR